MFHGRQFSLIFFFERARFVSMGEMRVIMMKIAGLSRLHGFLLLRSGS